MKELVACYIVRGEHGERGRFFLREGEHPKDAGGRSYWCELVCNTGYGAVGHYWGNMGRPAAEFLASLNKGYLLTKLWGLEAQVYHGPTAVRSAKEQLFRARRNDRMSRDLAREVFDAVDDLGSDPSEYDWVECIRDNDFLYGLALDGELRSQALNPMAEGFWRDLWPAFLAELQEQPLRVVNA